MTDNPNARFRSEDLTTTDLGTNKAHLTDRLLTAMFEEVNTIEDIVKQGFRNEFAHSRKKALTGLQKRKIFKAVDEYSVPIGTQIYR